MNSFQMWKRFITSSNQILVVSNKHAHSILLRTSASAACSAEGKEKSNDAETKTKPKKKPLPERRRFYQSPARDLLYGIHPIEIALAEKRRTFYKLYMKKKGVRGMYLNEKLNDIEDWATKLQIPIHYKPRQEMSYWTNDGLHQGVILQASKLKPVDWSEEMQIFGKSDDEGKLLVYLDCIQDPMNMGAVIRSCVFLGADSILIPTEHSCHLSPTVSKASSGALECASIHTVKDPHQFMTFVHKLGWDILGTDSDCQPYDQYEVTSKNRLLVLGNEGHGVNEELVNFFTTTVCVPGVTNRVGSLNVSVTAAILLSHFAKLKRAAQ